MLLESFYKYFKLISSSAHIIPIHFFICKDFYLLITISLLNNGAKFSKLKTYIVCQKNKIVNCNNKLNFIFFFTYLCIYAKNILVGLYYT